MMRPDCTEGFGPVDTNGPEPATLNVPIYNMSETDLMAAFEQVIDCWKQDGANTSDAMIARAVRWLHDKYGETP